MQGYIPVEIPTKKYIKAYIHHRLGAMPFMKTDSTIGAKLYDVLQHTSNERKTEFANVRYDARIRLYIPRHSFLQRGCFLNETNIKNFNLFVEAEIKDRYRFIMDNLIEMLPSFQNNLPELRRKIGIDIDSWSCDSIRKDYYRYRKAAGLPPLYEKNIYTRTVPRHELLLKAS